MEPVEDQRTRQEKLRDLKAALNEVGELLEWVESAVDDDVWTVASALANQAANVLHNAIEGIK